MQFKKIKQNAKRVLKKHFFRNIVITFISLLIINGGYSYVTQSARSTANNRVVKEVEKINKKSKSNADLLDDIEKNGKKDVRYARAEVKGNTKNLTNLLVNELTKSKSFFLGFLNSINKVIFKKNYKLISILALLSVIYLLYIILIKYPIIIGKARYFLEKNRFEDTKIEKLFFAYRVKRQIHLSFSLLLKNIYQALWNLTIIGGIVKRYSYFLVPYILAENPDIKAKDAIRLSKDMMNGYKFKVFLLELTLIPWYLLGFITVGLSDVLYFDAYKECIYSSFYMTLRKIYKKENKDALKLLNDEILDGKVTLGCYPEEKIEKRFKAPNVLKGLDFDRRYSITSLILLFFTFSFIGWIWEVTLHLVSDGVFVNRGTMFGPWLPIYGTGGILILVLLKPFRKSHWLLFITAFILCGIVEYFTGWYLETFKHMKWWDYSGYIFNIDGRVCLEGLIIFGLGGCAFTYCLAPLIDNLYKNINPNLKSTICLILILLFAVDMVYSHFNPNCGDGITSKVLNICVNKKDKQIN